jgi:RNA polymerase primary sigma factor
MPKNNAARLPAPKNILSVDRYVIEDSLHLYQTWNLCPESRLSHTQLIYLIKTGILPKQVRGQRTFTLREIVASQISGYESTTGWVFPDEVLEKYGWKKSGLEALAEKPTLKLVRKLRESPSSKEEETSEDRQYFKDIHQYPVLSRQEEIEIARRVRQGNPEAREKMIVSNLRFVVWTAEHFKGSGMDFMDLVSEGNRGLMCAVERFNPERGVKFSTYAGYWINNFIMRALKKKKAVHIPFYISDIMSRVRKFESSYLTSHENLPSTEEISKGTDLSPKKIENAKKARFSLLSFSFCEKSDEDRRSDSLEDVEELISRETQEAREVKTSNHELFEKVMEVYNELDERSKFVLKYRFGLEGCQPETLEKIGGRINRTRERVRQIERIALDYMKARLCQSKNSSEARVVRSSHGYLNFSKMLEEFLKRIQDN